MDIIIEQIDKLNEYLHLSSDLNKKDFNYFNTMLQSMRNEAINYTRSCTELKVVDSEDDWIEEMIDKETMSAEWRRQNL